MEDRRTQHVQTLVVPIFFFLSAYTVTLIREDFFSSRDDNGVVHPSHFFVLHYTHQLCHSRKMQKVISTLLKVGVPYLKQDDLRFPDQPKKMYDIPQGGEYVPAVYVHMVSMMDRLLAQQNSVQRGRSCCLLKNFTVGKNTQVI